MHAQSGLLVFIFLQLPVQLDDAIFDGRFGFQVLGFGFLVSGFWFRVSGFEFFNPKPGTRNQKR
ncbi:MAG: hypothetical protein B6243_13930 [Anaerolineaceae bacterium 4572_5.2]|nr:MAG: hypothetical protein B6243_13930 [Anaerolineaceae bacterium 4572_5.2]